MEPFFTIDRRALLSALGVAIKIVEAKNTIPVLSCFLLQYKGSSLTIKSTDLDFEIVVSADVNDGSDESMTIAAPAHRLHDIVKVCDSNEIRFEEKDEGSVQPVLVVSFQGGPTFRLQTLPAEDFPEGPDRTKIVGDPVWFRNGRLPILFKRLLPSVSTEETRYYLNGIYFHNYDDGYKLASTNGHMLTVCSQPGEERLPEAARGFILPRKAADVMRSLAKGDVSLAFGSTAFVSKFDGITVSGKLIDATYPDYERVIPQDTPGVTTFNAGAICKAVQQVSAIANERKRAIEIRHIKGELEISMKDPDAGSGTITLPVMSTDVPDDFKTGFNSSYLQTMLAGIGGTITVSGIAQTGDGQLSMAKKSAGPMLFKADDWPNTIRVLMPMRV